MVIIILIMNQTSNITLLSINRRSTLKGANMKLTAHETKFYDI